MFIDGIQLDVDRGGVWPLGWMAARGFSTCLGLQSDGVSGQLRCSRIESALMKTKLMRIHQGYYSLPPCLIRCASPRSGPLSDEECGMNVSPSVAANNNNNNNVKQVELLSAGAP